MIAVKIHGRLGNQMFQYSFARKLASEFSTFFILNIENDRLSIYKYFKINKFNRLEYLFFYIINYKFVSFLKNKIVKRLNFINANNGLQDYCTILKQTSNNTYLEGFFQSALYFQDIDVQIKSAFEVQTKYQIEFQKKYAKYFQENKILVIHYRGTDYFDWGSDLWGGRNMTLPWAYYENCINQIQDIESYKIIVISDSIDFLKPYFAKYSNVTFESNNEIVDFQILLNSDALIISCSSYAWWGAYLNKKKPIVFAPKYWLGFKVKQEYPVGIMENLNWNWINI